MQLWQQVKVALVPVLLKLAVHPHASLTLHNALRSRAAGAIN